MDVSQLQMQYLDLARSLLAEKGLGEQFKKVQSIAGDKTAINVIAQFLNSSEEALNIMSQEIEQTKLDYAKLGEQAHRIKGTSICIGAHRIVNLVTEYEDYCKAKKRRPCVRNVQDIKQECAVLNEKLRRLLRLMREIVAAKAPIPPLE